MIKNLLTLSLLFIALISASAQSFTQYLHVDQGNTNAMILDGTYNSVVEITRPPSHGTFSHNDAGGIILQLLYESDAAFIGIDTVELKIENTIGTAPVIHDYRLIYYVVETLDSPTAFDDQYEVETGASVELNVMENDYLGTGDPVTLSVLSQPSFGTASVTADQTIQFVSGGTGDVSFQYEICVTGGSCSSAWVDVQSVFAPPMAINDAATVDVNESVTIDVLANDENFITPMSISITTPPTKGTAEITPDNKVLYTSTGSLGQDIFQYEVCGADGTCATADIVVEVVDIPEVPIELNLVTEVDVPVLDWNALYYSPDNWSSGFLTLEPSNGTVTFLLDEWVFNPTTNKDQYVGRAILYEPAPGFVGTDEFRIWIQHPSMIEYELIYQVEVKPEGSTINAVQDSMLVEVAPKATSIPVLVNDSGFYLEVTEVSTPSNGTATISDEKNYITYTPDPGFEGEEVFTYTICDHNDYCDQAEIKLTVNPFFDSSVYSFNEYTYKETPVYFNLAEEYNFLDFITQPQNGTLEYLDSPVSLETPSGGYIVLNRSIKYTPDPGFVGLDLFMIDAEFEGSGYMERTQMIIQVIENTTGDENPRVNYELGLVVNTDQPEENVSLNIFPNPVHDFLRIEISETPDEIRIVDITGRQVYARTDSDFEEEISVSHFPEGMYILQIRKGSNWVNKKFLKF